MANQEPGSGKKKMTARKTTKRAAKAVATKKRDVSAAKPKPTGRQRARAGATSSDAPVPAERPRILTWQRRHEMIAEAAYYRAERRGFVGGDPADDWREAEAEVDRLLIEHPERLD
ncbi:MAG TPA: DUF2934 domain-containing protein [Candidatus Polarisedimenticolaceae bacterium]|nr:DUF2934 domain-containing protein [Candidatus Polarisedimenticolaceae bacterium]